MIVTVPSLEYSIMASGNCEHISRSCSSLKHGAVSVAGGCSAMLSAVRTAMPLLYLYGSYGNLRIALTHSHSAVLRFGPQPDGVYGAVFWLVALSACAK